MTLNQVMKQLEAMGTAQNRKIYARHGSGPEQFGVSFANLGKLKKQIKTDHALAKELWATGNTDAMTLATMVGDAAQMSARDLEAWLKPLDYYLLVDVFVGNLASKSGHARAKADKWIKSKSEWIGRAGWLLVAKLAMEEQELPDTYFELLIERIEGGIHTAKNRTRDAMNSALIAIGLRGPALEKLAKAAARRIGKVEVDHGETGCKTPDAIAYIDRSKKHRRAKKAKSRAGRSRARPRAST